MNITCFNTWKEFFTFKLEALPESEDDAIKTDFMAQDSELGKWLCIASEQHQLVLAKIADNQSPVILHSFLTVQGTRREFGLQKIKTVVLNGLARRAQAASVLAADLFNTKEVVNYPIKSIFRTETKEEISALVEKVVAAFVNDTEDSAGTCTLPPCVILPRHIALAFLDTTSASALDLFLIAKEAIIRKLSTMTQTETDLQGDITIHSSMADANLQFSEATVLENGGNVLQWLLASLDDDMVAVKAQIPMSGTVIQDAAITAEFLRLGKETPQSANDETPGNRASINESFENLREILHGATNNFVEKNSGCKINDKLFLAQLRMAASTDKERQGDLSDTGMLIWKTKDLDSKKALFARELRAKGVQDATLTASQSKSFCVGDWHYNPANPSGTSIHLMAAPGIGHEAIVENDRIITTKLQLQMQDKITDSEFIKYSDKSVKVPSTLDEMLEVFQLHCTCFEVFLTSNSVAVDSYQSFITDLKEMRGRLRQKIAGDENYIFSLMHLVDLTWNTFFEQCYMHFDSPELIDFDNIELDRLISKIKNNDLKIDVFPAYYKELTMAKEDTQVRGREMEVEHKSKKIKKTLTNDSPNKDWTLHAGEDFQKFQDAPGRSKPGKVCLKWWMKNECDSSCRKKKSHHVLSEHQKKEMNAFVKSLRNNK